MKHPVQPLEMVEGILRFKQNKIIRKLLDFSSEHGYSLNEIAKEYHDDEDYVQLMQLIGYSVVGNCDLNCVSDEEYERVNKQVDNFNKDKKEK